MRRHYQRRVSIPTFSLLLLLATSRATLGQLPGCYAPWSSTTTFNGYYANGQIGLAGFGNQLIATWGDYFTNDLMASVYNGTSWSSPEDLSTGLGFPEVMNGLNTSKTLGGGGVNMTTSTGCPASIGNAAYVIWVDTTGQNIMAARYNGTTWSPPFGELLYNTATVNPPTLTTSSGVSTFSTDPPPPNRFWTAAPALFGSNYSAPPGYSTALPIGFAFPQYYMPEIQSAASGQGSSWNTYAYGIILGQFACDFSTVNVSTRNVCLFYEAPNSCSDASVGAWEFDEGFDQDYLWGPWSPLWTGAVGPKGQQYELRALALGNPVGNDNPPIWYSFGTPYWYSQTGPAPGCLGTDCMPGNKPFYAGQWTNDGIGGAINPADGTAWFVYNQKYFNSDTKGDLYYTLYHAITNGTPGQSQICTMDPNNGGSGGPAGFSNAMPSMTFWKNQLWIASTNGGSVNIESIPPAAIGWNGQEACLGGGTSCLTNAQCCTGVCSGGYCTAPCLNNLQACTSSSQCCSGYCGYGYCDNSGCLAPGASCGSGSACCSGVCQYSRCGSMP
jgi:hypothetical protein